MSAAVQHVFRGERLQAFSDAVFSIVATIMIIPLKLNPNNVTADFVLTEYLYDIYPSLLIYLFSFVLVVDTWYSHSRIFSIVEQVDDVIVWLNLLSLLFISFLPYGIGIVSRFQGSRPEGFELAVTICSTIIILTGVAMIILVLYAFRKQALLHPEMAGNSEVRSVKAGLLITLGVNPILALIAMIFILVNTEVTQIISLVFFYSMGLGSLVVRTILHLLHHRKRYALPDLAMTIFRTIASKSRTEAFSDGLFSIVATLIVLDFTTEIPTSVSVEEDHKNLKRALGKRQFIYLAYVASFCIVGLLWFVQYGMFQFLKKLTPTLSFVNTLTLCLVGGIPFISSIYVIFADNEQTIKTIHAAENELVAIRMAVVLVFLVGVSQLIFWTVALHQKSECLSEEVDRYPAETLMFVKIMIFPTVSGLLFGLTFSKSLTTRHFYGALIVLTPFIFLLVKSGFVIQQCLKTRAERIHHRMTKSENYRQTPEKHTVIGSTKPSISSPINNFPPEDVPLKPTNV